jgi:hypothetical protein
MQGEGPLPYVHYNWPAKTIVRDFSRALPVYDGASSQGSDLNRLAFNDSIAFLRGFPVSRRTRIGAGEFIFLGSPLGPHLGGSDREAQALLEALLRRS